MSNPPIKNLLYKETEVGKTIKSTKVLFTWEFYLDDKPHKIELYDSRLSGKRKLLRNGQLIKEVVQDTTFIKTFEIGSHSVTIIQHGEKYELRIDNQSFSHMMDLEKNKNHFGGSTHTTTSNVSTNNFKLNSGSVKQATFGTGIISNQSQNTGKPALFNFAIKPANQNNPNFANRKFGGAEGNASVNHGSGVGSGNNSSKDVVVQVNAGNGNGVNLLDFGEVAGNVNNANNATNNYGGGINLLGDGNYANVNANNNTQNANNNNNLLDPFDIINSLSNSNAINNNNNMSGIVNNNNNTQTNLFGVEITKPNTTDKAQNLLEAMYSVNNNQNSGFVDFSKQGNTQMNAGMNPLYNQNQYNLGLPANNTMIMNNDMMFNNMPGNNQINLGYGMNNAGYNNQMGFNPNQMGGPQYNMNMNINYGSSNNAMNHGYPQQQQNLNQNQNKNQKDLLDDLF